MSQEKFYKFSLKTLLFEQEEEEADIFGGDEEEETEEATAEGAEEEDEAAEEEGAEDEGGEEDSEEDTAAVDAEPSLDGEIEAVLIDFETSARKAAVSEGNLKLMYEAEEVLDLDSFTADVARLVKNYDNLIDMEALLVNKSKEFLGARYGEEVVNQFVDRLEKNHDIEDPQDVPPIPTVGETPLAVGAGSVGG